MKLCSTPVSYFQPSRPLASSVEAGQKESRRLFFQHFLFSRTATLLAIVALIVSF